ncbi:MAG: SDR family oxidoreductase [Pseudomonadota bacterium]
MATTFQPDLLKGKTALISGGTRGINLGIARGLMEHGAKVVVFGRDQERAANAEAELQKIGGGDAMGLSCDVRDYDGVADVVKRTAEAYGTLDIVIAGAAGNFFAPVVGLSANAFKTVIDIDLLGTFNLFRASFDHLAKPGASLIAITAGQADSPRAFQAHACAAKAGVNQLTKTLAIEWGPAGVRANLISPGAIADTEGVKFLSNDPAKFEESIQRIPSRFLGEVEDIADAAIFLSSDAARYVNGQVMYVDGGIGAGDGREDALTPRRRD